MNHNFVFFDGSGSYFRIARNDLESFPNCLIREYGYLPDSGKVTQFLFKTHTSRKINEKRKVLPLQGIWNKTYIGQLYFPEKKPICFLFSTFLTRYYDMNLFGFLRAKYPDCKLVLMLRDTFAVCKKQFGDREPEELRRTFDEIYTINSYDVEKYGFKLINVMCSRYKIPDKYDFEFSDIVFVGKAKDRTTVINRLYDRFIAEGLKCDFTLLSSDPSLQVSRGITIIDKPMDYEEMLARTMKSQCILEVTQKDISSLSSRCLEALCYNKKLITDVKSVIDLPYYDDKYIQVFSNVEDIDVSFIKNKTAVDYQYDDMFSPINLLRTIDNDLSVGR